MGFSLGIQLTQRVTVFIDAQNMYRGVRRAFFAGDGFHVRGQFRPLVLAQECWQSAETGQIVNRDFELISRAL